MIQTPYLIQCAQINVPIADKNTRLSQAVDMEKQIETLQKQLGKNGCL